MAVESSVLLFESDGRFVASSYPGCVSFTVMNKGTEGVVLFHNFPLNPGDAPLTLDYPWPKQRKDNMDIKFGSGGGTQILYIWLTMDDDYTE